MRRTPGTEPPGVRAGAWVATAALVACTALLAPPADARSVELRWRWPEKQGSARLAGFRIYTRHVDQPWGPPRDVGLPAKHGDVYRVTLELSDTDATYVSVTAYDAEGRESERSNERLFLLPAPEEEPKPR
jgi:hypothetical protein